MLRIFSAIFFFCITCLPVQAFTITPVKSPGGIEAWLVQDKTVPLISMQFSFKGGSAADPEDKIGLAKFLTTMLDEGAGDMKSHEFQQAEEDLAMRLSFSADDDRFTGTFQTLSAKRDEAFKLLALAVNAPRFDADPLERMRAQLLLSRAQSDEDPNAIAMRELLQKSMPGHPYARISEGNEESLKSITSDDLRGLHQRLFTRDGLHIAVVGDIDADTLGLLLDQTFGKLPATSGMVDTPDVQAFTQSQTLVISRDIPQSIIYFAMPGMKRSDPDFIPAYVMNMMLGGGGFGSRLMEEVREKRGLSYSVWSDLYPLQHGGIILGGAATRNEKASETIAIMKEQIAKFAEQGPSEQELADVKTYMTGSYPLRFASGRGTTAQLLGIQEENLGLDYVEKRNSLIDAVSLKDIQRVAKKWLQDKPMIFVVVGKPEGMSN